MSISALDFKLGLRMLRRYPGITAIGTVAMAVAIALGMLYFEGLNKALHPTLPVAEGDRIIAIRYFDSAKRESEGAIAPRFRDLAHAGSGPSISSGAALVFSRNLVTEDRRVEPVRGAEITANAFTLMGTAPLLGRTLVARDEQPAEPLGGGHRRAALDDAVRPRSVRRGPSRESGHRRPRRSSASCRSASAFPMNQRLWMPLRTDGSLLAPRTGPPVTIFGRLAPGVSRQQAQAELDAIAARTGRRQSARPTRICSVTVVRVRHAALRRRRAVVVTKLLYAANTHLPAAARRHLHQRRDARVRADRDTRLGGGRAERARRQPRPHHRAAVRRGARDGAGRGRPRDRRWRNWRCGGD